MPEQTEKREDTVRYFNFPKVERKVFERNFLDQVIIELRFPTLLRMKEKEPSEIQ